MEILASSFIRHPRERVFRAYRDELPKIAAYMPNVKQVVVESRAESPGVVAMHNVWYGKGEMPKVAQSVLKPEILLWDDWATWHEAQSYCEWRIGLRVFNEKFSCSGTNHIRAEGAYARVELRGDLQIDLRDIPGVPRLLAGTLRPQIEALIVKMIRPNLEETNVALGRYLDANPG
jgi:hypothetical protein